MEQESQFKREMSKIDFTAEEIQRYDEVIEELKELDNYGAIEIITMLKKKVEKLRKTEDRLGSKVERMNQIVEELTFNLGEAQFNSENANASVKTLLEENMELKRELDTSHLREQDYQELIESLRNQTENLEAVTEKMKKEHNDLAIELGISGKTKEAFFKQRDVLKKENLVLNNELGNTRTKQDETEKELSKTKADLNKTQLELEEMKKMLEELQRDKGYMSKESEIQRSLVHQLKKNLILLKTHHDNVWLELDSMKNALDIYRVKLYNTERLNKELRNGIRSDQVEISNLSKKISNLNKFNAELKSINNERDTEVSGLKNKVAKTEMKVRQCEKHARTKELKRQTEAVERHTREIRMSNQSAVMGLESSRKKLEEMYKKLSKQFHVVSVHLLKTSNLALETMKKLDKQVKTSRIIEQERDQIRRQLHSYYLSNLGLLVQKDKCKQEYVSLEQKLEGELLLVRHKERTIIHLKKEIEEGKMDIKKYKTVYDEMKTERNVIARGLSEYQYLAEELKRQNKIISKELDQLKEQLTTKENDFVKVERINRRKMNESVKLKWQLSKTRNQLKATKDLSNSYEKENIFNLRVLDQTNKKWDSISKVLTKTKTEKGVILTQLDRKNAEMTCLQQNVSFMNIILKKGDRQYNQRLDDIRLLRIEVQKLRREKAMVLKALENSADLRQEIYHLYSDLNKERTKCTALEQEIQTPVNYHRWRILEGTDPDQMELLNKIRVLESSLIQSRETVGKKSFEIEELKATIEELKTKMARMPGSEVHEIITNLRFELKQKDEEMKTLSSVLASSDFKMSKLELQCKMCKQELDEYKKKFYELKLKADREKMNQLEIKDIRAADARRPSTKVEKNVTYKKKGVLPDDATEITDISTRTISVECKRIK